MTCRRLLVRRPLPVLAILSALILVGCNRPTCDPSSFSAPRVPYSIHHDEPAGWHLTWGVGEDGCRPSDFRLVVSEHYDFADVMASVDTSGEPGPGDSIYSELQADSSLFDFQPAHIYYWKVAGVEGSSVGPFSSIVQIIIGSPCQANDDLGQLSLHYPTSGAEIDILTPALGWTHTGSCLPNFHACLVRGQISSSWLEELVQGEPACLAWTATGSTVFPIGEGYPPIPDCSRYTWQVRAGSHWNPLTAPGSVSEIGEFSVNASGTCCGAAVVPLAPSLTSPAPFEVVFPDAPGPLVPHVTLTWENPEGDCQPAGYAVQLASDPSFSDSSLNGETTGPQTTYDVPVGLRAATQYWWTVAAVGMVETGPASDPRSFFTGPLCSSAAQLTPPELVSPDDEAILNENFASLRFRAGSPGCIPDGYFVDLQTSPTFTEPSLLGDLPQPETTAVTDALEDCTDYYWRVAAVQDGIRGPFSETHDFSTDTAPFCPQRPYLALVNTDALCRMGPSTQYPVVGTLNAGVQAEIVGRNADAGWLAIRRPTGAGTCFIYGGLLDFTGDAASLPLVDSPPLPTAEATALTCSAGLGQTECVAAGGTWDSGPTHAPRCVCP